MRQRQQFGQIGRDQQDRGSVGGKTGDQFVNFPLGPDIDSSGGLIDNQDPAFGRQAAREHNLLLIPARQPARRPAP